MSPDSNQVIVAPWFHPIRLEAPKFKKKKKNNLVAEAQALQAAI